MERLIDDPMINTLMDNELINVASTLIAKMDRPAFDENRTSIFITPWGGALFALCAEKLMDRPFDIDEWYRSIKKDARTRRDIDPSIHVQPITTDWMTALLQLEIESNSVKRVKGSFLKVLHNLLELEDSAQRKLADLCKKDMQYNCLGIAKQTLPGRLLIAGPARPSDPGPGTVEDLLGRSKK